MRLHTSPLALALVSRQAVQDATTTEQALQSSTYRGEISAATATATPAPATPSPSINLFASPPPVIKKRGFIFKTEPELRQESFDIMYMTNDTSLLAPGYIFMTPYPGVTPWGAQMYDMQGNLVWHYGPDEKAQDFFACDFLGQIGDHLCMHDRTHGNSKLVLDNTYSVVQQYRTQMFGGGPNGHEFNMLPGGKSFLQAVVKPKTIDYADNPNQGKHGTYILDGCFQEVDVRTARSLFQWCGTDKDHVHVWDTDLNMNIEGQLNNTSWKAGEGTKEAPWDYFHVNSADKYDEDYLVSSRHLDQILKVAGPKNKHGVAPGKVLWRLGGKTNDFAMDFTFSKQHAIRVLSFTSSETTVSILDNAWEGTNTPSASTSSAKIIKINNDTMTATLLRQYDHPQKMNAAGQGEAQVLPNGNMFVGWGRIPDVSEYTQDGRLLYYARFATRRHNRSDTLNVLEPPLRESSYRSVKHPWVGRPKYKPKFLVLVEQDSSCPVRAYMSWNGATEVAKWRVWTRLALDSPWAFAGETDKTGFETSMCIVHPAAAWPFSVPFWAKAEALDKDGNLLGKKWTTVVFPHTGHIALVLLVAFIEGLSFAYGLILYYIMDCRTHPPWLVHAVYHHV